MIRLNLFLLILFTLFLTVVPALAQDKQVVIERVEINGKQVTKDFRVRIKTKAAEFEAKTNAEGFVVPGEALTTSTNDLVDVIITVDGHVLNFSELHTSNFNVHWRLLGIKTPPFDPPSDADLVYFISFAGNPGRVTSVSIKYDKKRKSANTGSLEMPERLKLTGKGEPELGVSWEKQPFITESFYPVGWSRDGKFAYYVEPADEACGCYFGKFVIQDLKTDKILWQDDYTGEMEAVPEETLETFWPTKQKEYAAKLKQYGIEPAGSFRLLHPSIELDGDVLTPHIDVRIKTDGVFEVEGEITVNMESKRLGTKAIMRDIYKKDELNTIRNAEVAGSLLSPFEPRAAVIVVQEMRGYEGPPNITRIKVVGSTLKTGFSRWGDPKIPARNRSLPQK